MELHSGWGKVGPCRRGCATVSGAACAQQRLAYDLVTLPAQCGTFMLQRLTRACEAPLCDRLGKVSLKGPA